MRQYTKHNWPELIEAFKESGLNQTQFCKQQNLNAKYFNQKLNRSRRVAEPKFIPVDVVSNSVPEKTFGISISIGDCTIRCPDNFPIESVAALVRSLT